MTGNPDLMDFEFSINRDSPKPAPCGCPSRAEANDKPCEKLMANGRCSDMPSAVCGQFRGDASGNIVRF